MYSLPQLQNSTLTEMTTKEKQREKEQRKSGDETKSLNLTETKAVEQQQIAASTGLWSDFIRLTNQVVNPCVCCCSALSRPVGHSEFHHKN